MRLLTRILFSLRGGLEGVRDEAPARSTAGAAECCRGSHGSRSERRADSVVLAHEVGLTRFDRDYYALQLGNHVLGGEFYATRLYHDLRQEAGLVYTVDDNLTILGLTTLRGDP